MRFAGVAALIAAAGCMPAPDFCVSDEACGALICRDGLCVSPADGRDAAVGGVDGASSIDMGVTEPRDPGTESDSEPDPGPVDAGFPDAGFPDAGFRLFPAEVVVEYDFIQAPGKTIFDKGSLGVDLAVVTPGGSGMIRWGGGALTVDLGTTRPVLDLHPRLTSTRGDEVAALMSSAAGFSIEVVIWPHTLNDPQQRSIVSISDAMGRALTLGQQGDSMWTMSASVSRALEWTWTPSLSAEKTHVVLTVDPRNALAGVFVNGAGRIGPSYLHVGGWQDAVLTIAGDAMSADDRTWQGDLHLVAVYSRSLGAAEISRLHRHRAR